jgi:antirestriction protein
LGALSEMPENLRNYFDHEGYLRDLKMGGEIGFVLFEGAVYAFWN